MVLGAAGSPAGQQVVGDAGESGSWIGPGADTAMQLRCRTPGRGTLIQRHGRRPLNKGHVAGAGSALACVYLEGKVGPGVWVGARCGALRWCQGWGQGLGRSPGSLHPVLRLQSSPGVTSRRAQVCPRSAATWGLSRAKACT